MNRLMIFDCENICTKKLNYIIENLKDWDVILYFGNSQRMNNLPKIDGLEVIQASGTGKNYAVYCQRSTRYSAQSEPQSGFCRRQKF